MSVAWKQLILALALATPASADCTSDIKTMMASQFTSGPYHMSVDQTWDGGSKENEADVIPPDGFHMIAPLEGIMLKEGVWLQRGGTWSKLPDDEGAKLSSQIWQSAKSGLSSNTDNISNAQCLGPQQIEGQTLAGYAFDSSVENMGLKVSGHVMAYADDKGRPLIMVIDAESQGKKIHAVEHLKYDPAITIVPPK